MGGQSVPTRFPGTCSTGIRIEAENPWSRLVPSICVSAEDSPGEGLRPGDNGTVVHICAGDEAYEMEFMALAGQTVAVVTLLPPQLRPVAPPDLARLREVTIV